MPDFNVTFEVFCAECGNGLCNVSETGEGRLQNARGLWVKVSPCEKCMTSSKSSGYDDGHGEGYDEGYEKAQEQFDHA